MLIEERDWIVENIQPYLKDIKEIIDIGSGSEQYRGEKQPYISELFEFLQSKSAKLTTLDMDKDSEADVIADISKLADWNKKYDLVLATSVLEHIEPVSFESAVNNIKKMVKNGKYLIVTVPYRANIHKQPIDNGFRPSESELFSLFKNSFSLLKSSLVECKHYREPYLSNPSLAPEPVITCISLKKLS